MHAAVNCPKCGRLLQPEGELTVSRAILPFYSCPECVMRAEVFGKKTELPLSFVLGPDGRIIDPGDPEGEIDLTGYE